MVYIQQTNPATDCLASWKTVFSSKIDEAEAIPHLLNALDTSFGYTCYAKAEAKQTELDDLVTHKRTWEKAEAFCRHDQKIRSAHRYSQIHLAEGGVVRQLCDKLMS